VIRLDEILDEVRSYAPDADLGLIRKAWVFADKYHRGQRRKSGEPYFAHPLEVAYILASLRMDTDSLVVAILHDTVEDTEAGLDDIDRMFGPEVAQMVDGVTKLSKLDFRTKEEHQAENFRKLVFAMARDIRVIVVKLADRVHNMRTLGAMPPEKRARIARETMDLYAPIANRLGIVFLKGELEDLSFRHLHPEAYAGLEAEIAARAPYFDAYIEKMVTTIYSSLQPADGEVLVVKGRVKRLWSIWRKMQEKQLTFEEVHDLLAFRITVGSLAHCYGALGVVHSLWAPVSEKFKDYIAQPKANGYQSLHTVVVGPDGQRIEVQIRTAEMHRFAEYGIAAHWKYKEGRLALTKEEIEKYTKVRQLLQWAEDIEDSREFLDVLKVDLYSDQVHVYTPRGDIRWFPQGATPLDFAYSIHTEVGHHCSGARINGRLVKLNYRLRSGDSLEIVTKPEQHPKKEWLQMAVTSRALSKIRHHLRRAERERALEMGRTLVDQELRKHGTTLKAVLKADGLRKALDEFRCRTAEEFYAGVGFGNHDLQIMLPLYISPEKLAKERAKVQQDHPDATPTLTALHPARRDAPAVPVEVGGGDSGGADLRERHLQLSLRHEVVAAAVGEVDPGRPVPKGPGGRDRGVARRVGRRDDVEGAPAGRPEGAVVGVQPEARPGRRRITNRFHRIRIRRTAREHQEAEESAGVQDRPPATNRAASSPPRAARTSWAPTSPLRSSRRAV
jgi:GTP pyrophosphokinase